MKSVIAVALLLLGVCGELSAEIPRLISHQGRIAVDGANFDGTGQFKFLLYKHSDSPAVPAPLVDVALWSNATTSPADLNEPAVAVSVPVAKGHYSVLLGDPSPPNMAALPGDLALDPPYNHLLLRLWFDGGSGFERLAPDREISAAPYALEAEKAPWAGVTGIPPDLADGDDDTTYSAGDGLLLNNDIFNVNFAGSGSLLTAARSDHVHGVQWADLFGVPSDLADGDDDTQYAAGAGLQLSGTTIGLAAPYLDGSAHDARFVNAGEANSVSSGMLQNNAITADKIVPSIVSSVGGVSNDGGDIALVAGQGITIQTNDATDEVTIWANGDLEPSWHLAGNAGTIPATHYLGTSDNQPLEVRVNGLRALRFEPDPTCPNAIAGFGVNLAFPGVHGATIGGGGSSAEHNQVTDHFGTVGGGQSNQAGDAAGTLSGAPNATVGGGNLNKAAAVYATVAGGADNHALAHAATVAGGSSNRANAFNTAVGGGYGNEAGVAGDQGRNATIGGGYDNAAAGNNSTVPGGSLNVASGNDSLAAGTRAKATHAGAFVWADGTDADFPSAGVNTFNVRAAGGVNLDVDTAGGGLSLLSNATSPNLIAGYSGNSITAGAVGAAVSGGGRAGLPNSVTDDYGAIGGGGGNRAGSDQVSATYATVAGGQNNAASATGSTVGGGQGNIASGGTIIGSNPPILVGYATVAGGAVNKATHTYSTVGGGSGNQASGASSTVAGGDSNQASGDHGVVAGGASNTAGQWGATVGGGDSNTANGQWASVLGGLLNTAGGDYATVAGGSANGAPGEHATVPGGENNTAQGTHSLAAGYHANAQHAGSFVWSDSRVATDFPSQRDHQFLVRAYGGARFEDGNTLWVELSYLTTRVIDTSTGAYLSSAGVWTNFSDANGKENFAPVDSRDVLRRVAALPITTWSHKAQDPAIRHMGPMAQDFHAAFGLGDSDKAIGTIDADGVALAAIKGLHEAVQGQEAEIADLKRRLERLEALFSKQQAGGR